VPDIYDNLSYILYTSM